MSLLDDVSIVVTPNGYKAGELYAVIPVPTEGAEEVTNGDFATDLSGWNIQGTNATNTITWESNGARIISTGANIGIAQNTLTIGKTYRLTCDVAITVGKIGLDGATSGSTVNMVEGFNEIIFTATSITFKIKRITGNDNCLLDNVSVKEYTAADMDVTRATASTRVDENGLVNYAEVIGGEEVTDGNFPTPNTEWSSFGLATINENIVNFVDAGSNTYSGITQDINSFSAKQYKVEITVTNWISGDILATFSSNTKSFNITGNGTYSVYLTPVSNGNDIGLVRNYSSGANFSYSITNVSVKEVTRDNVPRIDYTGCPHILAEPQRTNLITYSEDFSDSSWSKQSGVTATYNTTETLSPDGTYNATKFIGNGSAGVYKTGASVSGVVARTVYLKSITGTVNVVLKDPNNTVTSKSLTVTEEWQRFELIESNATSTQGLWVDDIPVSGIYMWGAQLEAGSYATSYIPTSGSAVTRNQDIFTRDGISSLINSTEGVLFLEAAALSNDGTNRFLFISDGTNDNGVRFYYSTTNNQIVLRYYVSGAATCIISFTLPNALNFNKIAFKWKVNDFALWVDGVEVGTDSSGAVLSANTLNSVSLTTGVGASPFFSKVKQLQVYKTALTDVQLEALTT